MHQRTKLTPCLAAMMIAIVLLGLLPARGAFAAPTTYHVAQTGSDTASGSATAPFRTISKCAAVMQPGDTCLIGSGTYRETVRPAVSGQSGQPITFAPESGAAVVVSGTETLGGWTSYSGNIYVADLPTGLSSLGEQNQLFIRNGTNVTPLWEARWPNIADYTLPALKNGVATAQDGSATTLVSSALTQPDGYWVGATLWERGGDAYVAQSTKVTAFDSASHTLTYQPMAGNFDYMYPRLGSTYYLSGLLSELDAPREWYVDAAARKVYLWAPGGGVPAGVEIKQRLKAFDLNARSYIHINGLQIFGANIPMDGGASYNALDGITAEYLYFSTESHGTSVAHQLTGGINISGSHNEIKNSTIGYSTGTLVNIDGSDNRIVNNVIHDGSYMASYDPLIKLSTGAHNLISHNDIKNSGRYNIYWSTGSAEIQYNDIHDGMWLSRDGALIYSWGTDMGNSEIHHNLIHDSQGTDMSVGLYFDNYASNAIVHHNVIYNNNVGIQLNTPGNYRLIYNNTVADNDLSSVGYWGSAPYSQELYGSRVYNNIFTNTVSLTADTASGFNTTSAAGVNFANVAAHDYRLGAGSTAINAGAVIPGITTGYVGPAPDAGAYEYGGTDWTAGPNLASPPNPSYTQIDTPYMNLAQNGGFSSSLDGWLKWSTTTTSTAQVPSAAGTQAWQKRGYQTMLKLGSGGGVEQKITGLKPDTDYKFVVWVYNEPGETIHIGALNFGGTTVDVVSTDTEYTRKEVPFRTGPTTTEARIRIYKANAATGNSYADDAGMFETTTFDPGVSLSTLKEVKIDEASPVYTVDDQGTLPLAGTLQDNTAADLSAAAVQVASSDSGVLRIDSASGAGAAFTALAPGQVTVTATVTLGGITKAATKVVTVFPEDPNTAVDGWAIRTYGTGARGFVTEDSGGSYSLVGTGENVWNAADNFVYLSKEIELADPDDKVTLTATIDSFGSGDPASIGLMLRAQDTADSKHVHFRTDGTGNVLRFVFRNEESILDSQKPPAQQQYWGSATGLALDYAGKSIPSPFRMKLVKEGNTVTGYYYKEGAWQLMNTTTVEFGSGDFLAGIGMFAGAGKLPVKAVISSLDVQIES